MLSAMASLAALAAASGGPLCPAGTVELSRDEAARVLDCLKIDALTMKQIEELKPENLAKLAREDRLALETRRAALASGQEALPRKRPARGASALRLAGASIRPNVLALIGFVLPQLRRGTGAVPLDRVMSAAGVDRFLAEDDFRRLTARGDIILNGARCANAGEPVSAEVRLVVPALPSLRFEVAASVSGDIAENDAGGFTISGAKGLRAGLSAFGMRRIDEIEITPDAVRVSRRFGFDFTVDLTRAE